MFAFLLISPAHTLPLPTHGPYGGLPGAALAYLSLLRYAHSMGETQPQTLDMYCTPTGYSPFDAWLRGLSDGQARARIRARLARVRLGNVGDAHAVGRGVWELRIDYGSGYRVYYARSGPATLLLLGGGDKTTQPADIAHAHAAWAAYQRRPQDV